jgi:hypothetical protein
MEITEGTLLDLVKGQATLTQAVMDIKERFDTALPYLAKQDEKNAKAIRSVEKKIWYFGGAGTAIGYIIEHFGVKHFGGKG